MDTIEFYDRGGIGNPQLSKDIKPLKLTAQEKLDLVAFLEALQGDVNNATPPDKLPE
jgi:cytochrome c peroxidase